MVVNREQTNTNSQPILALRAEDGAWYEPPAAELEQARVTDPALLTEVRGHAATTGNSPAASAGDNEQLTVLSIGRLALHRVDDARASQLEADVEVTGFGEWDHRGYFTRDLILIDIGGDHGTQKWQFTKGYLLASPPSSRFPGGSHLAR